MTGRRLLLLQGRKCRPTRPEGRTTRGLGWRGVGDGHGSVVAVGDGGGRGLVIGRGRGGPPWKRPRWCPLPFVVIAVMVVSAALVLVAMAAAAYAAASAAAAAAAARPGGCGWGAKAVHAADGSVAPCRYELGGQEGRDAGHGQDVYGIAVIVSVVGGFAS